MIRWRVSGRWSEMDVSTEHIEKVD